MSIPVPKEADVLKACLDYLNVVRGFLAWRQNTGARPWQDARGRRRLFRYGQVGSGDIFAVLKPDGLFLSVECKRPGGKPTPAQVAWADAVRRSGGLALVVSSVADLEAGLREAGY